MHSFKVSKAINHSIENVWPLLDDFANTAVYHPIVELSRSTNGVTSGQGAQRECMMYDGSRVEERIVEHDPLNHRYRIEVVEMGPFPLTEMAVWVRATAADAATIVTYEGHFKPKFGPFGWLMAKLVMKRQFETMLDSLIDGIALHLSTGRRIEKGGATGHLIRATA